MPRFKFSFGASIPTSSSRLETSPPTGAKIPFEPLGCGERPHCTFRLERASPFILLPGRAFPFQGYTSAEAGILVYTFLGQASPHKAEASISTSRLRLGRASPLQDFGWGERPHFKTSAGASVPTSRLRLGRAPPHQDIDWGERPHIKTSAGASVPTSRLRLGRASPHQGFGWGERPQIKTSAGASVPTPKLRLGRASPFLHSWGMSPPSSLRLGRASPLQIFGRDELFCTSVVSSPSSHRFNRSSTLVIRRSSSRIPPSLWQQL